VPPDDVTASIISYEEQIRGWMAVIAQARTAERQVPFYREMERLLRFYCITPLLPFDEKAVRGEIASKVLKSICP
jgi:tRNA(fMet)-specific endonuclease VapC